MVKYNQYFFVASSVRIPSYTFSSAQQGMQEDLRRYFAAGSFSYFLTAPLYAEDSSCNNAGETSSPEREANER